MSDVKIMLNQQGVNEMRKLAAKVSGAADQLRSLYVRLDQAISENAGGLSGEDRKYWLETVQLISAEASAIQNTAEGLVPRMLETAQQMQGFLDSSPSGQGGSGTSAMGGSMGMHMQQASEERGGGHGRTR